MRKNIIILVLLVLMPMVFVTTKVVAESEEPVCEQHVFGLDHITVYPGCETYGEALMVCYNKSDSVLKIVLCRENSALCR